MINWTMINERLIYIMNLIVTILLTSWINKSFIMQSNQNAIFICIFSTVYLRLDCRICLRMYSFQVFQDVIQCYEIARSLQSQHVPW